MGLSCIPIMYACANKRGGTSTMGMSVPCIITAHIAKRAKVMFSQACVSLILFGGGV